MARNLVTLQHDWPVSGNWKLACTKSYRLVGCLERLGHQYPQVFRNGWLLRFQSCMWLLSIPAKD